MIFRNTHIIEINVTQARSYARSGKKVYSITRKKTEFVVESG